MSKLAFILGFILIYRPGGVMVIVEENEHGDTSSNLGRSWLHFKKYLYALERYETSYPSSNYE